MLIIIVRLPSYFRGGGRTSFKVCHVDYYRSPTPPVFRGVGERVLRFAMLTIIVRLPPLVSGGWANEF